MRKLPLGLATLLAAAVAQNSVFAAGVGEGKSYHGPTGLQLYSLRDLFKEQGVAPMLDQVREVGLQVRRGGRHLRPDAGRSSRPNSTNAGWCRSAATSPTTVCATTSTA